MTRIDIFSGFLGAGKTTLIKKLIKEAYVGEKLVLIENEFGEIGIDGGFLQDSGIEITEMNSGCICCSLVGDFTEALKKVIREFAPDRILIEPSGVGKLSDVIRAVSEIDDHDAVLGSFTTVADVNKCKMYIKNFGEFYCDQIENAGCIILSHTDNAKEEKIAEALSLIREHNKNATIVTTPWDELSGKQILEASERKNTLVDELSELEHHHHDYEECHCHKHHHHDEEECHCHEHHHHADEVFSSWGVETTKSFTEDEIKAILSEFAEGDEKYGMILRAKGILRGGDGTWIHFDYVPGEPDVRLGCAAVIGRLCVIGSKINEEKIAEAFGV